MKIIRDTWLIFKHNLVITLRNPVFVLVGLFQPICFLVLFAPLLKSLTVIPAFAISNPLSMYIPGLMIMMGMYGTSYAGFSLITEWRGGILERLWVSPASRIALVLGKALRDVVVLLAQSIILIGLSFFFGLEANFTGICITLALVGLIGITLSSCSYTLALLLKEEKALAATINFFLLPIQLLAGVTLPLTLAPQWLKTLAKYNPLYHTVEGARDLFAGNLSTSSVYFSFVLMALLSIITVYFLIRTYKNKAVA
jgi:ABC-2 type transport system permease protein